MVVEKHYRHMSRDERDAAQNKAARLSFEIQDALIKTPPLQEFMRKLSELYHLEERGVPVAAGYRAFFELY